MNLRRQKFSRFAQRVCSVRAEQLKNGKKNSFLGNGLTIKTIKKMKKNLFVVAAVAMFAAVSCNKELPQDQISAGDVVTFEASTDGADTKVSLDGKVSKWESGDKITIHNGQKGFEFSTTDAGATAKFTYSGSDFSGDKFLAVYPAGTYTTDVEAMTVVANIPTYQPSRDNNISTGAVPSVAYSETQSLMFRNAATLLKFTVKGSKVKGLVFYGNNNEAVSGNIKVSLNADNTIKTIEAQETTITENNVTETKMLTWAKVWANTANWCFTEGTTYYLAVVPQKFTKGFTAQLEIDGVGTVDVKKLDTEYELKPNTIVDLGELEYVAPSVEELNWGIAGTMTNWADGKDIAMTAEGEWYVAKEVTLEAGVEFKFRADGTWTNNRGPETATAVAEGVEVNLVAGGQNMTAAVPAIYDIYLSKAADKMKLVKVGDIEVEEPGDEPVPSDWGIVGDLTNWGGVADIKMFSYKGMYVAYNVEFSSAGGFKIRKNGEWNDAYNYGLASAGNVTAGHYYDVITSGGSGNLSVAAGTYDIWFDLAGKKIYILEPGADPSTATKGTAVAPLTSTWYLVGSFNGWTTNDAKYKMTAEGTWYVFKGLTLSANAEVKVCDGTWTINRGGSFSGVNKACSVAQGGANIKIPTAGTYDVYLNAAANKMYFMTPGTVPAE